MSALSQVPTSEVREVSLILKAIYAPKGRYAAKAKRTAVAGKLKALRLAKAAAWLEETVEETLVYYAFPDGPSVLTLAATRLRHIAGT